MSSSEEPAAGSGEPAAGSGEPAERGLGGSGALGGDGYDPPSTLRRYGPLAGIATVLVLVVGATVVLGGGDGDDEGDEDGPAVAEGVPDPVITWTMAEEQGIDADFNEDCDLERGNVAVPFFFASECVAADDTARDPDYSEDDVQGVTEDEITVVVWIPNTSDTAVELFQQGLGAAATPEEVMETYEGLVEVFNEYYETYGRTVELEFVQSSGDTLDGTIARADGREAVDREPFAVLGGPVTAVEWTQEIQEAGIFCLACPPVQDPAETTFTIIPEGWQVNEHVTSYVTTKLAGHPAEFAGSDDLAGQERVFGHLRFASSPDQEASAEDLNATLADEGVDVVETVVYDLDDTGAVEEQITGALSQFQEAGVTSILTFGEPIFFPGTTAEATAQDYYPEWILAGAPLIDMNAFARNADPDQWANAFGISYLPPAGPPELNPGYHLYEWYHGEPPPAYASLLLWYPQVALLFSALQYAGPDLSNETVVQAAYAVPPTPRSVYQPSLNVGSDGPFQHREDPDRLDHGGVDDMVELWWDPEAVVVDEAGNEAEGAYWYTNGAERFYPDEYTPDIDVFDEEGSVLSIDEDSIPPDERPPVYPSPAGG